MASQPPVTIAVLGRVGVGKSTLVNRILKREDAPTAFNGEAAFTQTVSVYENEVNGVAYRVIDTPGLQNISKGIENDRKIIDCILEKEPNVILYCISILPSSKLSEVDRRVVIEMNRVEKIWKRTIVVLTFANMVTLYGGKVIKEISQWTNDLQTTLNDAQVNNVTVKLCTDVYNDPTFVGIVSIPAGFNPGDKLPHSGNWIESLLVEIQRHKRYERLQRTTIHTQNYSRNYQSTRYTQYRSGIYDQFQRCTQSHRSTLIYATIFGSVHVIGLGVLFASGLVGRLALGLTALAFVAISLLFGVNYIVTVKRRHRTDK